MQPVQQGGGDIGQERRGILQRVGWVDIERQRQAAGGGCDGAAGQHEGEEFEQVQGRAAAALAKASEGCRGMDQHWRPHLPQGCARFFGRQRQ